MQTIINKTDRANQIANKMGYALTYHETLGLIPSDLTSEEIEIIKLVKPYTMTSIERIQTLINAVKYILDHHIKGAIVECGVWKGGSMMAVIKTLLNSANRGKNLYLFDTFAGMPKPTHFDISYNGGSAMEMFEKEKISDKSSHLDNVSLEEVKTNIKSLGYADQKIFFIQGCVEDTIPEKAPDKIALLRLDTDWYESTKHELNHLFPRLSKGGVLIIDDYGHWQGARKAVDEYIAKNNIQIFLARIDYTGRIGIKLS